MYLDTYKFEYTNNYKFFDNVSGIYALIYNDEVIYVGQSRNIKKRLGAHHCYETNIKRAMKNYEKDNRESYLNEKARYEFIRDHMKEIVFLVLPVETDKLDEVEEVYIDKYKPRFNWHGVRTAYPHSKKQPA